MARSMSTSLLDDLNGLISDESAQIAYKHELAMSAFTNDIARLAADQGLSQSELARRLGVSRARVSQLMQHKSSPTLRTMVEWAHVFGCDVTPALAPCGFRPARLFVADGGKTTAGYRQTKKLTDVMMNRAVTAERIAV
jgi:transcriptional regulator with XRE-family HTH domain